MNETHLNDIYISSKLKKQLSEISSYPMTLIYAPAGYGKTTAITWWQKDQKKCARNTAWYQLTAVDDNLVRFWEDICRLLKKDNPQIADKMLKIGCPENGHTVLLLSELWDSMKHGPEEDIYFILDDVHVLPPRELTKLLMFLADQLPPNIHIVLLSRNPVFTNSQRMKLGRNLYRISMEALQLDREDILAYAGQCGLQLSREDAGKLSAFSGGWVSVIYLCFCSFVHTGKWVFTSPDIDRQLREVMLENLSQREINFLTLVSLPPQFTAEQAAFLWGTPDAEEILGKLSRENAFITHDVAGVYRCHNLLRQSTLRYFTALPEEKKRAIWKRLGDWYISRTDYLSALTYYRKAEAWDAFADTIVLDCNGSFSGVHQEVLHEWCKSCPEAVLRSHPGAILTFALQHFLNGDIPTMLRMNGLLMDVVQTDASLSPRERGNLAGESEILLGFLKFNSISDMSIYHKKACSLMSRESVLVNRRTPWTFGAPSVLMLYHRESGRLDEENREMRESMPFYYQLTDSHGNGAEYSMQAETDLLRGNFDDAEISYWQASRRAAQKQQRSILLTAEFTAMRLELLRGAPEKAMERLSRLRRTILDREAFTLVPAVDMCAAWISFLQGQYDAIPQWITQEDAGLAVMRVAAPVFGVIQNLAFLARGEYTRLVAGGEEMAKLCENSNMLLCRIYLSIQLAAALCKLNRREQALIRLSAAAEAAFPDGLLLPFAEYFPYIRELLPELQEKYPEQTEKIFRLAHLLRPIPEEVWAEQENYGNFEVLSQREKEIAALAAEQKTTKEIADLLHLSEHTVKNHLSHVFGKLGIEGTARNKRRILEQRLKTEKQV